MYGQCPKCLQALTSNHQCPMQDPPSNNIVYTLKDGFPTGMTKDEYIADLTAKLERAEAENALLKTECGGYNCCPLAPELTRTKAIIPLAQAAVNSNKPGELGKLYRALDALAEGLANQTSEPSPSGSQRE